MLLNALAAVLQVAGIFYGLRWLRIRPSEITVEENVPIAVPIESDTIQPDHPQTQRVENV